ncbi:MAG TPA: alpha/beta hydrolase, partial [Bosea sp. (in: a-proteobacteria)]|nr:alpha/beta hydrolase [Bosea sp. (in: a-proteobacteria)]
MPNDRSSSLTDCSRRGLLCGGACVAAAGTLPLSSFARPDTVSSQNSRRSQRMNYVTTRDGVEIFYKDWGPKS